MTDAVGVGVGVPARSGQASAEQPGEQQGGDRDGGDHDERPATARECLARRFARADHSLVLPFDGKVDRLGDGQRKPLSAWAPRTTCVTDAEDVQGDADGHEDAAGDDERTGPWRGVRDRPGDGDRRRRRLRAVRGEQDAHRVGKLQRGDQEIVLGELLEPQVGSGGIASRLERPRASPKGSGVSAVRSGRRGVVGTGGRVARLDDGRTDLPLAVDADHVVGGVAEPRLEVGSPSVRGEDRPLTGRAKRLRTGHRGEHIALDEHVRSVVLDRDRRRLRLRPLEDRALRDPRSDHHGREHECCDGPHETHERTPSSGPRSTAQTTY